MQVRMASGCGSAVAERSQAERRHPHPHPQHRRTHSGPSIIWQRTWAQQRVLAHHRLAPHFALHAAPRVPDNPVPRLQLHAVQRRAAAGPRQAAQQRLLLILRQQRKAHAGRRQAGDSVARLRYVQGMRKAAMGRTPTHRSAKGETTPARRHWTPTPTPPQAGSSPVGKEVLRLALPYLGQLRNEERAGAHAHALHSSGARGAAGGHERWWGQASTGCRQGDGSRCCYRPSSLAHKPPPHQPTHLCDRL